MPSSSRRAFVIGTSGVLAAVAGCTAPGASSRSNHDESPPHWVTVYLGDREETHDVTVEITDGDGTTLFENEYHLSDSNEADEHATFPASTDPETVVVTVDEDQFERDWPGFEHPQLPCDGPNEAGIEITVENAQDGTPTIRLDADCQTVGGE